MAPVETMTRAGFKSDRRRRSARVPAELSTTATGDADGNTLHRRVERVGRQMRVACVVSISL